MKHKIYLLLGSNIGASEQHLRKAVQLIEKKIGAVLRSSSLYRTAAWGKTDQPDFINQVIICETSLEPSASMHRILAIEEEMGRVRTQKNAPRIIDIDILLFGKMIIQTPLLTVPHPLMQERNFVLVPMNELSPNLRHPVLQQTIHQLMLACSDRLAVKKN